MSDDKAKPSALATLATIDAVKLGEQYVLLERTDAAAIEGRILAAHRLESAAMEARLLAAQDRAIAERFAPRGRYRRPEPGRRYSAAREVRREIDDVEATAAVLEGGGFGLRRAGVSLMGIGLLLMLLAWLFGAGVLGPPGLDAGALTDGGYAAASYADTAAYADPAPPAAAFSLADSSPQMFGIGLLLLIGGAVATLLGGSRRGGLLDL